MCCHKVSHYVIQEFLRLIIYNDHYHTNHWFIGHLCIIQCYINTTEILLKACYVRTILHLPMITVFFSCARAVGNITYM